MLAVMELARADKTNFFKNGSNLNTPLIKVAHRIQKFQTKIILSYGLFWCCLPNKKKESHNLLVCPHLGSWVELTQQLVIYFKICIKKLKVFEVIKRKPNHNSVWLDLFFGQKSISC